MLSLLGFKPEIVAVHCQETLIRNIHLLTSILELEIISRDIILSIRFLDEGYDLRRYCHSTTSFTTFMMSQRNVAVEWQ